MMYGKYNYIMRYVKCHQGRASWTYTYIQRGKRGRERKYYNEYL
jgi:hypothetical protein